MAEVNGKVLTGEIDSEEVEFQENTSQEVS